MRRSAKTILGAGGSRERPAGAMPRRAANNDAIDAAIK
jgi:hypothetical protein